VTIVHGAKISQEDYDFSVVESAKLLIAEEEKQTKRVEKGGLHC
jgi:hypothetical protein